MKRWILALSLVLTSCRDEGHEQTQQQQLQQAQAEVAQQTEKTGHWQGVAALLGVGCVVFLVIGAAAGSKARKAVKNGR